MQRPSPLYTIRASRTKILISFIGLTIVQLGLYFSLNMYLGYTWEVLLIYFAFMVLTMAEVVLAVCAFKHGLPRVEFYSDACVIQLYTIYIHLPYSELYAFTLYKQVQYFKYFKYGTDFQLTLHLKTPQQQHNLYYQREIELKDFLIAAQYIFTNRQILNMAIIFYTLAEKTTENRVNLFNQLEQNQTRFEDLITVEELEKMKNNQYLTRYISI